ncbi:hypothetical protein [Leyella lascolaii]|uniref:hypothetical protein n=1 Tax=Leyella lascolaii TaxID=1776379 RepID=UPI002354B40B|nr:hypothetical protein [Leyella lascolaii]
MVTKSLFQKIAVSFMILLISLPFADICAQSYRGSTEWNNAVRSARERRARSIRNQQLFDELWKSNKDKKKKNKKNKKEKTNTDKKAQLVSGDVQLTVFADGKNKDEAIQTALRSAIEQAFGVFVSSHTEILNDSLVKDEIATVASGNIKSFECLSENYVDGKCLVNVRAVVSTNNLINYTKSKGGSAELAGSTFAMEMRLQELNRQNEIKAIDHLIFQLAEIAPSLFDFHVALGSPKKDEDKYECPITIRCTINENAKIMYDLLISTLSALSMDYNEYKEYCKLGMDGHIVKIGDPYNPILTYYLRTDHTNAFGTLEAWLSFCSRSFKLIDDFGEYENEFVPPHEPIQIWVFGRSFYPEQYFDLHSDHIKLSDKGNWALSNCGQIYMGGAMSLGMVFIPNTQRSSNQDPSLVRPNGNIEEGYITFSDLSTLSKFSNIRIERVNPKLSFTDFKTIVIEQEKPKE